MKKLLLLSALVATVVTSEVQASGAVRKFLIGAGVAAASGYSLKELVDANQRKKDASDFDLKMRVLTRSFQLEKAIDKEAAEIEKVWGGGFDHTGVPLWVGEELKRRGLSVERVNSRKRQLDEYRAILEENFRK